MAQLPTTDIDQHTRLVQVGEQIYPVVDTGGEGPVVLLLHGFPDSRHLWRYQIPVLADAGFRVIAPDLKGYGDAPKPTEVKEYMIPSVIADLLALMDSLEVRRFHLVGHDWGAATAWIMTALNPNRISKLVVLSVGCPGTSGTRTFEQLERSWYALLFRYADDAEDWAKANDWEFMRKLMKGNGDKERYLKDLARPGALTAALNWYKANFNLKKHSTFQLPRITCPVMGVWSDGDNYLTEEHVTGSVENIDGPWRYEKVTNASHWLMLDQPQEVNRLLVDFLGE